MKIGRTTYIVDFVVIWTHEIPGMEVFFRWPFLATISAKLDFKNNLINLKTYGEDIILPLIKKKSIMKDQDPFKALKEEFLKQLPTQDPN